MSESQSEAITALSSAASMCEAFQATARASGDRVALRRADGSQSLTWEETRVRVARIANGLAAHGVGTGGAVAILLRNVPEFHLVDLATLHLGAVPVSLYATDPVERLRGVVEASGSTVLVTEPYFADQASQLVSSCPRLVAVVDIADSPGPDMQSLTDLEATPETIDFEATWRSVGPDDTACLLYTSGTTGAPKGVELSHRAILTSMVNYAHRAPVTPNGRVISYLPTAHIADRFAGHYAAIAYGHALTTVPDHEALFATIREVEPTHFFTVPRVLEKLCAVALDEIAGDPEAVEVLASRRTRLHERGHTAWRAPEDRDPRFAAARSALGLGEAEWLTVGSAPSSRGIVETLAAMDLPFADIWGMTEIIVSTMNPPEEIRFGSIGRAFDGVELKVASDGELLARGANRFTRFRNDPERTAAALDPGGWVLTGDLAEIDDAGYVRIVGRKKEIMINAAGKNISPLEIEGALKSASPLVDHVAAVGDGRRYVTALICLDGSRVQELAARQGLSGDFATLTRHELVRAEVARAVEAANLSLARVEQIRRWTIVPEEWVPGGAEVTASMKLMRPAVLLRYAPLVEDLYATEPH